jgi:hypothetical protein
MPLSTPVRPTYERLAAPDTHLGVLIEPSAPILHEAITAPAPDTYAQTALLDTTLTALRTDLRQRLGLTGRIVLTGHQAEFFHAGVFAKTIATHALALHVGAMPVFLLVDSDLPKTIHLSLPQTTSAGVRRVEVDIPGAAPHHPFESQPAVPREHWLQFFARAASLYEFHDQSLLGVFARGWLSAAGPAPTYCDALSAGRTATELALGLEGVREVRLSAVAATPEFRMFAAHLLLHAEACAAAYNAAQAEYRRRHRVRTPGRPVPPLATTGGRVELPLWVYQPQQPRRRLYVASRGAQLELLADSVLIGRMSRTELARRATHTQLWPIEQAGWRLRPRALALSGFCRLLLSDLFIHGIGGAKYDEMMEDFVQRLLGVAPRPLACVTATLQLPLPHVGVKPADIVAARHASHDLRYNPQRHLRRAPAELVRTRAELVRRSADLRIHDPRDRASRRAVFGEIRRVSAQMLATDPWRAAQYDERIRVLEEQYALDRVALDREYFYALHPQAALEQLIRALRDKLAPAHPARAGSA